MYVGILNSEFEPSDYVGKIAFKRSDDAVSPALTLAVTNFTYNNTTYKGYTTTLNSDWYLAKAGTLKATVSIATYSSGAVVSNLAYGIFNIQVQENVSAEAEDTTITDEEYDAIQIALLSKLNIVDGISVATIDTITENQFIPRHLYFDIGNQEFYWSAATFAGGFSSAEMILHLDNGSSVNGTITGSATWTGNHRFTGQVNFDGPAVFGDDVEFDGDAILTGHTTITDAEISNAEIAESLFTGYSQFNSAVLFNGTTTLGSNALLDASVGFVKIKNIALLNINDSSYATYPTSIKTMLDYVADQRTAIEVEIQANATSDRAYAADLVNTLKQQVQNGTVQAYGATNAVHALEADFATRAQYDSAGNQFTTYYLKYIDIVDDLTSLETLKPLSAYQGKRLKDMIDAIQAIIASDDVSLDTIQEIVAYIKDNKADIDELLATKVNISDIIDNLTSTLTNKPLSANQGRVLKGLIDAIVNGTTTVANATHAVNADEATHATSADSATQATQDAQGNTIHTHYYSKEDGFAIGLVSVTDYDEDTGEITLEYNSEAVTNISYNDSTGEVTFTY